MRYTVVPRDLIARNEQHAGFSSRRTAEYVALSLDEGRAQAGHYLWSTRLEPETRWCVVRRDGGHDVV